MRSLRTPRLQLTALQPVDVAPPFEVLAEPELHRYLLQPPTDAGVLEQRFPGWRRRAHRAGGSSGGRRRARHRGVRAPKLRFLGAAE